MTSVIRASSELAPRMLSVRRDERQRAGPASGARPMLRRLCPELRGGAACAFGERLQLHPHDLGVDLNPACKGAEAAIDAGDDVLAADHIGEIQDAVG